MAVISKASFFVGGCSGPKHLAMDYHIPTFTLYTATEPERWGASRDHDIHAYLTALPQKLTAMELHGLRDDHRPRLLDSEFASEKAAEHYYRVRRPG
jgi:ADP-heptose:LPS heptosyltransferase